MIYYFFFFFKLLSKYKVYLKTVGRSIFYLNLQRNLNFSHSRKLSTFVFTMRLLQPEKDSV